MIIINKTLYAGLTNEKALELMPCNTGYQLQRITDAEKLGVCYTLQDNETPEMFIEIDDGLTSEIIVKNNVIIAGVVNEEAFDICLNKEILYTGKTFVRIHDGFEMGNKIYLGIDYSYSNKPRVDLPKYYKEIEEEASEYEENQ